MFSEVIMIKENQNKVELSTGYITEISSSNFEEDNCRVKPCWSFEISIQTSFYHCYHLSSSSQGEEEGLSIRQLKEIRVICFQYGKFQIRFQVFVLIR